MAWYHTQGATVLRIAIVTLGIYPIQIGGVEILAFKQLQKLRKRGHEVICFAKKSPNDKLVATSESYPVHRVGSAIPIIGQVWFVIAVTLRLLRMRRDLDVIHIQYASYFILPAYVVRRLAGVPYIVGCVGSDILVWGRRRLWGRMLGELLRGASFVTALSTELKDALVERHRVPAARALVLPNAFDDEEVVGLSRGPAKGTRKVIFLGNLKPLKDPITAARAFAIMHERLPDSEMVLVGDGPCHEEITMFVRDNKLESHVLLRGQLDHEKAMEELRSSNLLIISSLSEGGPIAAMEAMALGVPVVSTSVGGLRDLISDGVNGLLVPPRASGALAEAMYKVLTDKSLAQRLVAEASRTIVGRSWANLIISYEDLYRRAAGIQGPRSQAASGTGQIGSEGQSLRLLE